MPCRPSARSPSAWIQSKRLTGGPVGEEEDGTSRGRAADGEASEPTSPAIREEDPGLFALEKRGHVVGDGLGLPLAQLEPAAQV